MQTNSSPEALHYKLVCPKRVKMFIRRKYSYDRWFGCLLLVAASPMILLAYLAVRATSRGPGFYRQDRVGLEGKVFKVVKLRSMRVDAESNGQAQWATKNDPRTTWLGKYLRKLHIDELPQLWNVAKGEMSLVGPRPERPEICEKLVREIDFYYQRIAVKPGITGLAQINLPPDETMDDVRRKQVLDLHYIEHACLWLDTKMIFATALRLTGLSGETIIRMMKLDYKHVIDDAAIEASASRKLPVHLARPIGTRSFTHSAAVVGAPVFRKSMAQTISEDTSLSNRPR